MIAVPYGFLVGNRGAMAGIGVSLASAWLQGSGHPVRKARRRESSAARHGGLVPGRHIRPRRVVPAVADAELAHVP